MPMCSVVLPPRITLDPNSVPNADAEADAEAEAKQKQSRSKAEAKQKQKQHADWRRRRTSKSLDETLQISARLQISALSVSLRGASQLTTSCTVSTIPCGTSLKPGTKLPMSTDWMDTFKRRSRGASKRLTISCQSSKVNNHTHPPTHDRERGAD